MLRNHEGKVKGEDFCSELSTLSVDHFLLGTDFMIPLHKRHGKDYQHLGTCLRPSLDPLCSLQPQAVTDICSHSQIAGLAS